MELKPGYKQTDVGVIPEDWNVKTIGDIADVKTEPFGSALHESDYVADGTPIITVEHLGDLRVNHFNLPMVSNQDKSRLKAYSLKAGDIVFSRVGSIDRNALIRELENGWLFSGRLLRVRINNTKDYPRYLSYHFHSEPFKRRVRGVAVGQTMPSLNTQLLKGVSIVLPTKEEQRSIATVLSDMDALLGTLDQLIAKKRDLKQATMQQLLTGKKRLPGFGEGKGYKQTEVAVIPEDWRLITLGEICTFENGDRSNSYPSPGSFVLSGIPFINAGHIADGQINSGDMNYITPESYDRIGGGKVKAGDILFCLRGSLGKFGLVNDDFGNGAIASSLVIVRPSLGRLSRKYLSCYFNSALCAKMIETWAGGAAQPNLGVQDLVRFSILLPPPPEQTAIATALSDMDTELAAMEQRRDKTRALKQGMMQELLTGRTRLL